LTDSDSSPQFQRKSAGISDVADREPRETDLRAFASLFHDVYRACFSAPFTAPLTESESHHLSVDIEERTGLEIGWKSLKNYSAYLAGRASRSENPTVATLDTLARYLAGAPRTTEERRRAEERHYPYWFRYREAFRQSELAAFAERAPDEKTGAERETPASAENETRGSGLPTVPNRSTQTMLIAALVAASIIVMLVIATVRRSAGKPKPFVDEFADVSSAALARRDWTVQSVDSAHWAERGSKPDHLTLFTLRGDNWPQSGEASVIRNLLVRSVSSECFMTELRLTSFYPIRNWQQAGILLMEDTAFAGRSMRLSIGFNDFSGGFPETKEVIVQGITSLGGAATKPEEIVHQRLFVEEPATEALVRRNLESSALRIEKRGTRVRLLYSAGPVKNGPFKEVGATEFDFRPRYVGVFALAGFVSDSVAMPVYVDAFGLAEERCSP
jgi:transcriptional regulator with XRE-family HTH domain